LTCLAQAGHLKPFATPNTVFLKPKANNSAWLTDYWLRRNTAVGETQLKSQPHSSKKTNATAKSMLFAAEWQSSIGRRAESLHSDTGRV
jgi:hypothetical protein